MIECKSWAWNMKNGECFLKNKFGNEFLKANDDFVSYHEMGDFYVWSVNGPSKDDAIEFKIITDAGSYTSADIYASLDLSGISIHPF